MTEKATLKTRETTTKMSTNESAPSISRDFASVRVYRLANPATLYQNARVIAKELFGMEDLQVGSRTFSVHPASGYLFYADGDGLWPESGGRLLPPQHEAERYARLFLEESNKRIVGNRTLRQERVGPLFPVDIRSVRVAGVVTKGSERPDHWLCEFAAFLQADSSHTARVEGALLDIRVGSKGRIVGLSSRWRPITGDLLSRERDQDRRNDAVFAGGAGTIRQPTPASLPSIAKTETALSEPEPEHGIEAHSHASIEFLYWLADENAPQVFLSPMYLEGDGEHRDVRAASAHTLSAQIWQRTVGTRMELAAVVDGGSGSYDYQWSYWTPGGFLVDGIIMLGTSQVVTVDRGSYQMLLGVKDRVTRSVVQVESAVYPKVEEKNAALGA